MGIVREFYQRPQNLWVRKLMFQIHLWVGLIVGLYIILIGLTGSILVYKYEIEEALIDRQAAIVRTANGIAQPDLASVAQAVRQAYPNKPLNAVYYRTLTGTPHYRAFLRDGPKTIAVSVDPASGKITGDFVFSASWIRWVELLHLHLLMGRTGLLINGIGSAFLLLLCVSGLVLWWPGIRNWARALKVDFRRSWKRINFDLHSAIGFWLLAVIAMWAVSGLQFTWPKQVNAAIGLLFPVSGDGEEEGGPRMRDRSGKPAGEADLRTILQTAQAANPGTVPYGIALPFRPGGPVSVYMARERLGDFSTSNYVFVDGASGKILRINKRGEQESFGDWLVWVLEPLHFGFWWGPWLKAAWFLFGLSLPILTITGALMYWNRSLRRIWRKLRGAERQRAPLKEPSPVTVERS